MIALSTFEVHTGHPPQGNGVQQLFGEAEQTGENLVRGNQYLDSAAKHSRDFRMFALVFLLVASFSLLFLDWYYP